jgi:putative PIN family toxin of toxin-antitoxin system
MKAERLVVDSNVWIAALLTPTGSARRLVNIVLARGIDVVFSESTFHELVTRLERPKFAKYRQPDAWNLFLSELVELAVWHDDTLTAAGVSRDSDDDKFLALAVTGQADAIISGGNDLLELVAYEGTPILTPTEFLLRLHDVKE